MKFVCKNIWGTSFLRMLTHILPYTQLLLRVFLTTSNRNSYWLLLLLVQAFFVQTELSWYFMSHRDTRGEKGTDTSRGRFDDRYSSTGAPTQN